MWGEPGEPGEPFERAEGIAFGKSSVIEEFFKLPLAPPNLMFLAISSSNMTRIRAVPIDERLIHKHLPFVSQIMDA